MQATDVSADQFEALFKEVSSWGRWGDDDDERGALNNVTADRVIQAAGLVRDGATVTLSLSLDTHPSQDNPEPAVHRMTLLPSADADTGSANFAKDYIGVDYHNDTHSHIDALCHVAYRGSIYNGRSADSVTAGGASASTIEVLKDGLVGRGVLLDVPRQRRVPWLEPGEQIFGQDLEAAETAQNVRFGQGDILLVRTGHARRLRELGPWDTANAKAGLHPTAVPLIAKRGVSALGSDGNSDTAPSSTEGVDFPIHVLTLNAAGIHLLDYLQFEDLTAACERAQRWKFLFVAAPLRIEGGTGSPLNPIAIL